jgi:hypothetical protein
MLRTVGRGALAVALLTAALPALAAEERPRPAKLDLSVSPPERDPVLLMLEADPELHARAVSGTNLREGGQALAVLGGIAIPVGLVFLMTDAWASAYEQSGSQPARASTRGLLVTGGGVAAIALGIALIRQGDDRRSEALRAYNERHRADPPAR